MSENCDICGRMRSTNRWCGPSECSAWWAGLHSDMYVASTECYRIGRERVMAERDAEKARADKVEAERDDLKAALHDADAEIFRLRSKIARLNGGSGEIPNG